MTDGVRIDVRGLNEARKKLLDLPEKLRRRVMIAAMRAGAKHPLQAARQAAPRGSKPLTKKQRDYRVSPANLSRSISIRARNRVGELSVFTYVRKRAFYGRYLEFGWKHRSGRRVPARPWFAPAVLNTTDQVSKTVVDAIWQNIDKALAP